MGDRWKSVLRWLALALVVGAVAVFSVPTLRWQVVGTLRGERFYHGRPSSYWRAELERTPEEVEAGAVAELREGGASAVPVLIAIMADRNSTARWAAARVVGLIGPPAESAIPTLQAMMDESEVITQHAAGDALNQIDRDANRKGWPGVPRGTVAPRRGRSQKELFEAALKDHNLQGCAVEIDDALPGKPIVKVALTDSRVEDQDLALLKGLDQLRILDLTGSQVSGQGLAYLQGLSQLREVRLSGKSGDIGPIMLRGLSGLRKLEFTADQSLTGAGLEQLANLTGLEELHLDVCPLTDEALASLRHLTALKVLNLGSTRLTGAGLKHLAGLTHLESLHLSGTEVDDAGLEHLKGLRSLRKLDVGFTRVQGAGLEHLKNLPLLEELHLNGSRVTDATLKHLHGLTSLRRLWLSDTAVGDAGLEHVASLKHLQFLTLEADRPESGRITGTGLEHLTGLKDLEVLNLNNQPVETQGLRSLQGLSNLQELSLFHTRVGDEGLRFLSALTRLELLDLGGTPITGDGLPNLQGLKRLRILNLGGTQVTDESLKHLATLTGLTDLSLGGTRITDAGLPHLEGLSRLEKLVCNRQVTEAAATRLQAHLPKAQIIYLPDKDRKRDP
jgi:Leucine-rich repeat (LRR) protein